jgi:hypothetical protein
MGIPPRHRYRNRRQHHPLPAPTRRSTCERLLHTLVYTRVGKCPAVHGSRGCNLLLVPLLDRTGGAATRELPFFASPACRRPTSVPTTRFFSRDITPNTLQGLYMGQSSQTTFGKSIRFLAFAYTPLRCHRSCSRLST